MIRVIDRNDERRRLGCTLEKTREMQRCNPFERIYSILHSDVDAAKASLENVPANLYESVCVPDLGDFLGYQGGHQVATPDHKNPPTPAGSATSNSSGTPQSGTQPPPIQPSSGAVSLPSRQYHNDGKSTFTIPPSATGEGSFTGYARV